MCFLPLHLGVTVEKMGQAGESSGPAKVCRGKAGAGGKGKKRCHDEVGLPDYGSPWCHHNEKELLWKPLQKIKHIKET